MKQTPSNRTVAKHTTYLITTSQMWSPIIHKLGAYQANISQIQKGPDNLKASSSRIKTDIQKLPPLIQPEYTNKFAGTSFVQKPRDGIVALMLGIP